MLSIDVGTTKHLQTSGRLVQEFNVCIVLVTRIIGLRSKQTTANRGYIHVHVIVVFSNIKFADVSLGAPCFALLYVLLLLYHNLCSFL